MDVLALFEADDFKFLSTKAHLESFAKKICSMGGELRSPGQTQEEEFTVFQMLKQISRCVYDRIELFLANVSDIPSSPESLPSIDTSVKLSKLLKYVCSFFIEPYLELTFANHLSRKIPISYSLSLNEKIKLLHENVINLCGLSEKNLFFQEILMHSCSLYLLTSLLQLCFSPTCARNFDINTRKSCLKFLNLFTTSWLTKNQLIKDSITIQDTVIKNSTSCSWLMQKCGSILTKILLGESGIETIIVTIVQNFNDTPEEAGEVWERVVALSSIITTLPSTGITAEDYCRLACPQLEKLLVTSRRNVTTHSKDIIRVAITTLHALHEKYPDDSKLFEEQLCNHLLACEEGCKPETGQNAGVELAQCIETLHQVCVSVGVAPASLVIMLLKPYVKILLCLLVKIPASSHLQSQISDLFYALLRKSEEAADILMATFCQRAKIKMPKKCLNFTIDESGVIIPVYVDVSDPSVLLQDLDRKVEILCDIITKHECLAGDVFLRLIERLCDPSKNIPQQIHQNKILTSSERATEAMELNEERFITFGLLTTLLNTCDPNMLLRNNRQVLEFVKTTMSDLPTKLRENVSESVEILRMCTSVIGICMLSDLGSTQLRSLNDLVPVLKRILSMDDVLDVETKELVSDLVVAISTYGAVNVATPDFSESMAKCLQDLTSLSNKDNKNQTKRDTVDKVCTDDAPSVESSKTSVKLDLHEDLSESDCSELDVNVDKSISEAMEDIHSTTPALKGGSVRYLTKCIKKQNPTVMSQIKVLIESFLECMEDNDSFVYLSAVQGLVVISTCCGKNLQNNALLERIVKEFLDDKKYDSDNGVLFKMKLGEVITRIIRDMGDMAPSHASVLLPTFLKLSRHSHSTVRASAMSNFAELAPMAPSTLSSMQFEVRDCLCGTSVSDVDVMVRRAAVYAMRSIISRLSDRILVVFPVAIKDIYDILKKLYRIDKDNIIQLHAQLALEELDQIMRETIFKPQELVKKISVLP